jgi:hypothetical protein
LFKGFDGRFDAEEIIYIVIAIEQAGLLVIVDGKGFFFSRCVDGNGLLFHVDR